METKHALQVEAGQGAWVKAREPAEAREAAEQEGVRQEHGARGRLCEAVVQRLGHRPACTPPRAQIHRLGDRQVQVPQGLCGDEPAAQGHDRDLEGDQRVSRGVRQGDGGALVCQAQCSEGARGAEVPRAQDAEAQGARGALGLNLVLNSVTRFDIKDDVQNYMSLYGLPRYNSAQDKTDLMMSLIPELCSECELSRSLQFELRLSDRDSKQAAFVREVAKMSELVVVRREGRGYAERVLKENISSQDIAAVIIHIRQANRKFYNIEYHIRSSTVTPELQRAGYIITFLHILCDRLNDGQEWKVKHEFQGPWTLYIMDENNIEREEKNPVSDPNTQPPAENSVARHHPLHFGSGRNPENTQLSNMLMRVKHSMR